jgi:hypothetical protein
VKTLIEVKQIFANDAKARAFAIRMRVFVREQGVPEGIGSIAMIGAPFFRFGFRQSGRTRAS